MLRRTRFQLILENKVKIAFAISAVIFGPGIYSAWDERQTAAKHEAAASAVASDASLAGAMLASARRQCGILGFSNDIPRCASYQGVLYQEQSAPMTAKMAVEMLDAYRRSCGKVYSAEYCDALVTRAFQLSVAQQNGEHE